MSVLTLVFHGCVLADLTCLLQTLVRYLVNVLKQRCLRGRPGINVKLLLMRTTMQCLKRASALLWTWPQHVSDSTSWTRLPCLSRGLWFFHGDKGGNISLLLPLLGTPSEWYSSPVRLSLWLYWYNQWPLTYNPEIETALHRWLPNRHPCQEWIDPQVVDKLGQGWISTKHAQICINSFQVQHQHSRFKVHTLYIIC